MLVISYHLSTSRWTLPLFVPRLPALVGGTLAVQALSGPTAAPPGLETTNAVYLTFGN